ncbi:MAG: diacylglycerol kinase [Candidatus Omnitrophica bacterium]|nr:diacylglycerol kinase [Candidatus Omnitrophota bacterium]MCM8798373.1 diacylglycerol kinase [Candidatus Omnitrophota bacterium]
MKKNNSFIESLNLAIEGFLEILRSQRNMRFHFLIAGLVISLGLYLNFNRLELSLLIVTISVVIFAEMVNTLVEYLLDLYKPEPDHRVKLIKDISAGSVLLSSLLALGVGYLLFFDRKHLPVDTFLLRIKQSEWHLTFFILFFLIVLVIGVKYFFQRGSPLRGGLPSGHSAFAFSVWTLTLLLQKNNIINFLVFLLAMLIARSRIKAKVHNLYETVMGAILGIIFTVLIYQLLL